MSLMKTVTKIFYSRNRLIGQRSILQFPIKLTPYKCKLWRHSRLIYGWLHQNNLQFLKKQSQGNNIETVWACYRGRYCFLEFSWIQIDIYYQYLDPPKMVVCALSDSFFLILKFGKNLSCSQYFRLGGQWQVNGQNFRCYLNIYHLFIEVGYR